uniref:GBD/FH3 domain-containing protein n=1 Tax=Elaeophora elaphi TaxID=1147741 RepID=A0A0R3S1F6_9BILA
MVMASMPKRRKTDELDEVETILLRDDVKQIKNIVLDFKETKKFDELKTKLNKYPRLAVTLMSVLWKCSLQSFDDQQVPKIMLKVKKHKLEPQWLQILNDVLCILTNIYGKMPYFCGELAESPGNFANITVRLLECGPKISLEAKCEVFRLISSIATNQRCLEMITENTHLVDRIAMAIDHEVDEVAKVALQTASALSVNKNGIKCRLFMDLKSKTICG